MNLIFEIVKKTLNISISAFHVKNLHTEICLYLQVAKLGEKMINIQKLSRTSDSVNAFKNTNPK